MNPPEICIFFLNHTKVVNLDYKTVIEVLLYCVIILYSFIFKPTLGKEREFRGKQWLRFFVIR